MLPSKLGDINWRPGKPSQSKPWPGIYKAGPCAAGPAHTKAFKEEILDGLSQLGEKQSALYITERNIVSDITFSDFLDRYRVPFMFDDDVDTTDGYATKHFEEFFEGINVPAKLSSDIERATRGQGCNPLWKEARSKLITASNFCRIIRMLPTTNVKSALATICGYTSVPRTVAIRYGQRNEARARKLYMRDHLKKCDPKTTVKTVGLVVSPQWPFLGASLDGLVECKTCGVGGLEIKCPWTLRLGQRSIVCFCNFCLLQLCILFIMFKFDVEI